MSSPTTSTTWRGRPEALPLCACATAEAAMISSGTMRRIIVEFLLNRRVVDCGLCCCLLLLEIGRGGSKKEDRHARLQFLQSQQNTFRTYGTHLAKRHDGRTEEKTVVHSPDFRWLAKTDGGAAIKTKSTLASWGFRYRWDKKRKQVLNHSSVLSNSQQEAQKQFQKSKRRGAANVLKSTTLLLEFWFEKNAWRDTGRQTLEKSRKKQQC